MGKNQKIIHKKPSYNLIGCAMEVHRALGPGQEEAFYHLALSEALRKKGLQFRFKPKGQLIHRGIQAAEFEADLMVEERIILELKALKAGFSSEHYAQLLSYLKFWDIHLGMLIDFGKQSLLHKRLPFCEKPKQRLCHGVPAFLNRLSKREEDLARSLMKAVSRLHNRYGVGYRQSACIGLVRAELAAEGIPFVENPRTTLTFGDKNLGTSEMQCFVVDDRCLIKVYGLYDNISAGGRARASSFLKHLDLSFGLAVNFGKKCQEIRPVYRNK